MPISTAASVLAKDGLDIIVMVFLPGDAYKNSVRCEEIELVALTSSKTMVTEEYECTANTQHMCKCQCFSDARKGRRKCDYLESVAPRFKFCPSVRGALTRKCNTNVKLQDMQQQVAQPRLTMPTRLLFGHFKR